MEIIPAVKMPMTDLFASKGINFKKLKSPNAHGFNYCYPPEAPGVYFLVGTRITDGVITKVSITYIGSSSNLSKRYNNHEVIKKISEFFYHVGFWFYQCDDFISLERSLIRMIRPEFNSHKYLFVRN
ncbi:MAG TPA: hypothetical protein DCZ95_14120 [Verrucomicrobia bacterium]|nr:hypothetical protein [Verrucomicrobiota bacterium]